ncbi:MAG: hypothetical protein HUJ61_06655 [Bacilli bacterium]|nr:hypothetical protein [Bacilli bacterium]
MKNKIKNFVRKENLTKEKEKVMMDYLSSDEKSFDKFATKNASLYNKDAIDWFMKFETNTFPFDEINKSTLNQLAFNIVMYKKTGSLVDFDNILNLIECRQNECSQNKNYTFIPIMCAVFFCCIFIVSILYLVGGSISGS